MVKPTIAPSAHLFHGAAVVGDVVIGEETSLWYNTVVRADYAPIRIGARTNLQDATVVHGDLGHPVDIGDDVTIGHTCVIHGCTVGAGSLVGMGSVLMNDVRVGNNCIIGAGSLLTGGTEVPDGMLAMGRPAKVVRALTEEEKAGALESAGEYLGFLREGIAHPEAQVFGV